MEEDALPQTPDTQLCSGCFLLWELTLCREGEMGGGGLWAKTSTKSRQKNKVFATTIPCIPAWKWFLGRYLKNQQPESLLTSSISWWWQSPSFPSPPCYQLANLPAHSDTQLREMKTVLLIDETLDKITWFWISWWHICLKSLLEDSLI